MAKPDKNGHMETLSIEQLNAIDLLVSGQTDLAVANAIGKTRQRVCHWRLHVPAFQAEMNRRRAEVWKCASDKLRSLIPKALTVFERELESEQHGFRAALAVMKFVTLPVAALGSQDAEEILTAAAKAKKDAEFDNLLNPQWIREQLLAKANDDDDAA